MASQKAPADSIGATPSCTAIDSMPFWRRLPSERVRARAAIGARRHRHPRPISGIAAVDAELTRIKQCVEAGTYVMHPRDVVVLLELQTTAANMAPLLFKSR